MIPLTKNTNTSPSSAKSSTTASTDQTGKSFLHPQNPSNTLQNRNRNLLPLRADTPKILPLLPRRGAHPPPPNHQARLPARRPRRAPLVHLRQHLLPPPLRSRNQDLGRQRLTRLPRFSRALAPRRRRSRTRVWFPMAPFRRLVRRC
jgi:hypothetical protein